MRLRNTVRRVQVDLRSCGGLISQAAVLRGAWGCVLRIKTQVCLPRLGAHRLGALLPKSKRDPYFLNSRAEFPNCGQHFKKSEGTLYFFKKNQPSIFLNFVRDFQSACTRFQKMVASFSFFH